jgi:hypothetical protein
MTAGRDVNNDQRKANTRLAWILASAAIVFALGFVAKIWLFAH